jgi:hypothetical protein
MVPLSHFLTIHTSLAPQEGDKTNNRPKYRSSPGSPGSPGNGNRLSNSWSALHNYISRTGFVSIQQLKPELRQKPNKL